MTPPVSIRRASLKEAGALARCRVKLFHELDGESARTTPEFESACRAAFEGSLAVESCVAWLAESPLEPEPIGNVVLLRFPRLPSPQNAATTEGYLLNVFVAPAWRHRGIASMLVGAAIDHARTSGLARLRLHTTPAGRGVYAGLGFQARDNEMELDLAYPEGK